MIPFFGDMCLSNGQFLSVFLKRDLNNRVTLFCTTVKFSQLSVLKICVQQSSCQNIHIGNLDTSYPALAFVRYLSVDHLVGLQHLEILKLSGIRQSEIMGDDPWGQLCKNATFHQLLMPSLLYITSNVLS
jgi:hypothetical protein